MHFEFTEDKLQERGGGGEGVLNKRIEMYLKPAGCEESAAISPVVPDCPVSHKRKHPGKRARERAPLPPLQREERHWGTEREGVESERERDLPVTLSEEKRLSHPVGGNCPVWQRCICCVFCMLGSFDPAGRLERDAIAHLWLSWSITDGQITKFLIEMRMEWYRLVLVKTKPHCTFIMAVFRQTRLAVQELRSSVLCLKMSSESRRCVC